MVTASSLANKTLYQQIIAYVIQSTAPPFALFLIAFFFSGVGVGLLDAEANTLIARLPDAEKQMSLLHAAYGTYGHILCHFII